MTPLGFSFRTNRPRGYQWVCIFLNGSMQAAEDNSITVVESAGDSFVDPNLNEKNLGTQYIYTTEGQLIPTSEDPSGTNLEITGAQHYNTEPQNIHIEQVDYQYDEQYSASSTAVETVGNDAQYSTVEVQESSSTIITQVTKTVETVTVEEIPKESADTVKESEPKEGSVKESEPKEDSVKEAIEEEEKLSEGQLLETLKDNPIIEIQQDESVEEITEEPEDTLTIDDSKEEEEEEVVEAVEPPPEPVVEDTNRAQKTTLEDSVVEGTEEPVVNGKSSKQRFGARLGVRMPPRNLTSRIVSRSEIENEIIERARKKEQSILEERKPVVLIKKPVGVKKDVKGVEVPKLKDVDNNANEEKKSNGKSKGTIEDNSDLLAILEGNDEVGDVMAVTPGKSNAKDSSHTDETNLKNLEREIALQQLHDLPYLEPKTKIVQPLKYKDSAPEKPAKIHIMSSSPIKSDNEPQVKVNMTLKTYSRKRKSTENAAPEPPLITPSKKIKEKPAEVKPVQTGGTPGDGIYVTKSSRVIKKKVIWDPDESPLKQKPVFMPKPAFSQPQTKSAVESLKKPTAEVKAKEEKVRSVVTDVKAKTDKKVSKEKTPVKKTVVVPIEKKKPVQVEKRASLSIQGKPKPKKPKSEVDRLLGDEGAIKMLYELKADKKQEQTNEQKGGVIRVDRTFKELAKKAHQIKSDLVNTSSAETPKNLRKKEANLSPSKASPMSPVPASIKRQKSKDSIRSNTPPRSPGSFFNNEAYLIRRRSSSSMESGDDLDTTGGSVDYEDSEVSFSKKHPITPSEDPLMTKPLKTPKRAQKKAAEIKQGQYRTFSLKRGNKSITIELYSFSTNYYFTSELLNELTAALTKASKEPDCLVVLIKSSNSSVFSKGLDYSELISEKEAVRKHQATKMAQSVKSFLECLAGFGKVLIAGVQGDCAGLAVTMLPLFDVVISSDDARFSANYVRLGCVPEAGFLLEPPFVQNGLMGRMVLANEKLTADEACRKGLVSTLCWPEKYHDTLKSTVADAAAEATPQSVKAIKGAVVRRKFQQAKEELDRMPQSLIKEWISDRCQENFKNLNSV
ncbi:titin isoform X2 [Anthonomus grandis grandis]|uniref:titin isoform X2 n=1 Tax=Anthonomus grandis grandis TaxID=2921223 RepID=UPI002165F4D9|nr:titin isoform X2 [Anthonomus grandis grandis]